MSLFISTRELSFIDSINKELIQKIIAQEVHYYAIGPEENMAVNVYGETIRKRHRAPIKLNALVNYSDEGVRSTGMGADKLYTCEVYCHTQELIERNLVPSEGDFIEFAQVFFEIASVSQPQLVFGDASKKIMTKLTCTTAREGQFAAGSSLEEQVDESHPVQPRQPVSLT